VPEAPEAEVLARAFIAALDIATDAHFAQQDWPSALRRLDAIIKVKRALERPAEDIGATRMNRAVVLGRLRRFGEAKAELEACLSLFQNNPSRAWPPCSPTPPSPRWSSGSASARCRWTSCSPPWTNSSPRPARRQRSRRND
jgi:hypothetical protein